MTMKKLRPMNSWPKSVPSPAARSAFSRTGRNTRPADAGSSPFRIVDDISSAFSCVRYLTDVKLPNLFAHIDLAARNVTNAFGRAAVCAPVILVHFADISELDSYAGIPVAAIIHVSQPQETPA